MKKFLLQIALFLSAGTLLHAQVYQQGFFLKDYRPVYRINPALFPDSDFVGGFEVSRNKVLNYGVSTFYYPYDGGLVTGLHESVSAETFLSGIPDMVSRNAEVSLNLFSYGIRRADAYHSFEIGIRIPSTVSVPKGIFELLKLGTVKNQYDLSNFGLKAQTYIELSYGYGRKLSDIVSIGGRAKLLLAMHGMSYRFTNFDVQKSDDGYTIFSTAELDMPSRFYKVNAIPGQDINLSDIRSHYVFPLPTGGGAAFDLGVAVTPSEYLTLSASILDLGGIAWHYGNYANDPAGEQDKTHEVGLLAPNRWGLYDMLGNGAELCLDVMASGSTNANVDYYKGADAVDPVGPASGKSTGYQGRHARRGSGVTNSLDRAQTTYKSCRADSRASINYSAGYAENAVRFVVPAVIP